jgi:hypothetical protein
MQEKREPLRDALNLRIDERLASEIDRIAQLRGESPSEVVRLLLSYGAEAHRRLEARRLMQHYGNEYGKEVAGRVEIKAEFVPYTWKEVMEMREEVEIDDPFSRLPTWDDVEP